MKRPGSDFELKFDNRKGYMYAHVTSAKDVEADAFDIVSEIMEQSARERSRKILIDCTPKELASPTYLQRAVDALTRMNHRARIAFVNCDGRTNGSVKLTPQIGLFSKVEKAEAWLSK